MRSAHRRRTPGRAEAERRPGPLLHRQFPRHRGVDLWRHARSRPRTLAPNRGRPPKRDPHRATSTARVPPRRSCLRPRYRRRAGLLQPNSLRRPPRAHDSDPARHRPGTETVTFAHENFPHTRGCRCLSDRGWIASCPLWDRDRDGATHPRAGHAGRRRHLAGALLGHRLRGPSHRLRLLGAVRVAGNHQGYQAETRGSDDRPEPNERPHFIVPFLCEGKRRALTAAPDSAKKTKRCPSAIAGRRACALHARSSPDSYESVNEAPALQKSTSARVAALPLPCLSLTKAVRVHAPQRPTTLRPSKALLHGS